VSARWGKAQPVVSILSGGNDFLRTRELKKAMKAASSEGRGVQFLDGEDEEGLRGILSGGFLFADPTLVIIENPSKIPNPDMVIKHLKSGDRDTLLVLHHEGASPRGKTNPLIQIGSEVPYQYVMSFLQPKPWDADEISVKFVLAEMAEHGKTMDDRLANALVGMLGTDLGVLSFEVLKISTFLDAKGATEATKDDVLAVVSTLGQANTEPVVEAVAVANGHRALKKMEELRRNSSSDPTMWLCARLGNQGIKWLHAAHLYEKGVHPKEAATRMGMKEFSYNRNLLPVGKRWGSKRLAAFVKRVVSVERAVKSGHTSPWIQLECILLASCKGVRRRG